MKRTDFLRGLGALVAAAVASPLLPQAPLDLTRTPSEEAEARRLAVLEVLSAVPWESHGEITRLVASSLQEAGCTGRVTAIAVGTNRSGRDVAVNVDFSEGPSVYAHWICLNGQSLEPGCYGLCQSGLKGDTESCINIYRSSR